jgi:uncharacterized protein
MTELYPRKQKFARAGKNSFFLWGARQTGKSTLLKNQFQHAINYDLLKSEVLLRLQKNPESLREYLVTQDNGQLVIIDEIQKIPKLLNEVHWLIENKRHQFILSGSSPRKILRGGINLLGGRAFKYHLFPLTSAEIPDFDLLRALNHGLLPRHYDAEEDIDMYLAAYIGSYLEDEIIAETRIRNIEIYIRFLDSAAFSNGEMVNLSNIAADCGISSNTVKEYFNILTESMIGYWLPSYQKRPKRRVVKSPKFYFFDVGVVGYLLKRKNIQLGTTDFGHALEHFMFMELHAYKHYSGQHFPMSFWRTSAGNEVDFVLGENEVAIEVKSTNNVQARHLKGLKSFAEEYTVKKKIIISTDPLPRLLEDDIYVMPWQYFLEKLWVGEII